MRTVLSDNEICQVIRDYVRENIYQYAIMLDGEWGCGKSWFVKNKVKPMFEEGRECSAYKYIYVSLYGVASIESLGKAVTAAYFAAVAPYKEKIMDIFSAFGTPLSEEIPYVGKTASEAIKQTVAAFRRKLVDLKNCFFVFDDLERCCMPVTEVLGYINRLIETEECKVLIVANEKECGQHKSGERELQMIAAKMLDEYMPAERNDDGEIRNRSQLPEGKLTRLKSFSRKLFRQDELYQKTKEKLIGRTLKYESEKKSVVSALFNKALPAIPYEFRCVLRDRCIATMQVEGVGNLRILQFALNCYAEINPIIEHLDVDRHLKEKIASDVIEAILKVSIRSRTSRKDTKWDVEWKEPEKAFAHIYCDDEHIGWGYADLMIYGFMSFRFVHEYVLDGKLDRGIARRDLTQYAKAIESDMQRVTGAFSNIDKGYWEITEDVLKENSGEVRRIFLENKYTPQMCLRVLSTFMFYQYEFRIEYCCCDDLKEHLLNEVKAGRIRFDFDHDGVLRVEALSGETKERFKEYLETLKDAQQAADKDAYKERINLFDDVNWSSVLLKHVAADSGTVEFSRKKGFIRYFDIDRLVEAFLAGDGNHYAIMLEVMRKVYRFGVQDFTDDQDSLLELSMRLRAADIRDRLIARSRDVFCKHAEEWAQKMKGVLMEETQLEEEE